MLELIMVLSVVLLPPIMSGYPKSPNQRGLLENGLPFGHLGLVWGPYLLALGH